jgi:hypothetical protein
MPGGQFSVRNLPHGSAHRPVSLPSRGLGGLPRGAPAVLLHPARALASAPRLPGRWLGQTHVRADNRDKVGHYRTDQIRPIATPNSVRLHRFFRGRISVSARHSIDHGTICGRSCAHSGHFKPLYARVNRTFCQIRRAGVSGIFFQGVGAAVGPPMVWPRRGVRLAGFPCSRSARHRAAPSPP